MARRTASSSTPPTIFFGPEVAGRRRSAAVAASAVLLATLTGGCSGSSSPPGSASTPGQSEFVSTAPGSGSGPRDSAGGATTSTGAPGSNNGTAAPQAASTNVNNKQVEETDLYRFDAATNRLYYLNGYRGLMVFDVSNIDDPKLIGRSPIFGWPVEMVVRGGIVAVVLGDWYGTAADGSPFYGSLVRGLDATDPANIRPIGEAQVGGWVRDSRVVGDPASPSAVLYLVSEDYGWSYGWAVGGGVASSTGTAAPINRGPAVLVNSVSFGPEGVHSVNEERFAQPTSNYCYYGGGGIFNVTNQSILLAHNHPPPGAAADAGVYSCPAPSQTDLEYLDITATDGRIQKRGVITVNGVAQGWGADNGRWNLDFADKTHAHVVGCASGYGYCGNNTDSYVLATADFSNPDAPVLASEMPVPATGWSATARFDANRMYLSPQSGFYYGNGGQPATPVQIYDLSNPAAPRLAGSTQIPGSVWLFMPSGNQLFALGNQETQIAGAAGYTGYGSQVSLSYLDVTNAAQPSLIGTANFGDGWAWTPAAGTFKAFIKDESQGLVVLPFGGWSAQDMKYTDGVQLIEFSAPSAGAAGRIGSAGAANTKGWVERGIFVKNRILSLSDLALAVVDYTDRAHPATVKELTLARNVVDATPQGNNIAELSSDWWGNDTTKSTLRVRPISDPEENRLDPAIRELDIPGANARVFHNAAGNTSYVVTDVPKTVPCPGSGDRGAATGGPTDSKDCQVWTERLQVVDVANGGASLRGSVELPIPANYGWYYYGGWGWSGYWYYDWYNGSSLVQVGDDVFAFRRWTYGTTYDQVASSLYVVDASNPDAPTLASTTITSDPTWWWGNMQAIGDTLYTTHYEWVTPASAGTGGTSVAGQSTTQAPSVRYYLDRIDLRDPAHPVVGSRINVPGILVGAKANDPSTIFTVDYQWDSQSQTTRNLLAALHLEGDRAVLLGVPLAINGYVGRVIVQNDKAYLSAESSGQDSAGMWWTKRQLHQIDLADPAHLVDVASDAQNGWGWLLDVVGDRAFVNSGWGDVGFDIYKLSAGAPVFDQFVRTRGWSTSSLKRQNDTVYIATGYWGVQAIDLAP